MQIFMKTVFNTTFILVQLKFQEMILFIRVLTDVAITLFAMPSALKTIALLVIESKQMLLHLFSTLPLFTEMMLIDQELSALLKTVIHVINTKLATVNNIL